MPSDDLERQLLSNWLDGEATAAEVQAAEALLAHSSEARQWVEEVRGLNRLLADIPAVRPAPARWWAPGRLLGPALASLAAVVVAALVLNLAPPQSGGELASAAPPPAETEPLAPPGTASFDCVLVLSDDSNYRVTLSGEEAQLVSLQFADGNQSSSWSFHSGEF